MTFIQPNQKSDIRNLILGVLIVFLLGTTFSLVVLYNHVVDLDHSIAADKVQLNIIGAENTSLKNKIIGMLDDSRLATMARADGLILENKPQYISGAGAPSTVAINK